MNKEPRVVIIGGGFGGLCAARELVGGFVIAARMPDKARADLLGINGEYNFIPAASTPISSRPARAIFGNARGGTPLMKSMQTVGIDLPLKAVVWEDASAKTWISYNEPAWITQRHGVSDAKGVVSKMTALLSSLTRKAANP